MLKRRKLTAVMMAMLLMLSLVLAGCGKPASNQTEQKNEPKQGEQKTTEPEKVAEKPQESPKETAPQYNKDRVFRDTDGWPKPPAYQGNPFAAGGVGWKCYSTVFEGLFAYVGVSGTIYNRLAESYEHNGNQTVIHLQGGVKWNDGQPFTSKDVWAYYTLNNGVNIMRYLKSIETPSDTTVVLTWMDPAPNDTLKLQLIAVDVQGTIPYHTYGKYVDKAAELLKNGKPTDEVSKRGAYGLEYDEQTVQDLDKNWQEFIKEAPPKPIGTGAFMLETVTASDMVLVKNPGYWQADRVKFDKIVMKQVDPNAGFAMLKAGQVERGDGTPNRDILESVLAGNKDLIHYQTLDNATVGMVFNIQKEPFNDPNFRRALQYVFAKDKIKDVGNYYGQTSEYSLIGMPLSYKDLWISKEVQDKMTKYNYDPQKAESLLKEIGWTKGSDGIWKDQKGKTYNFIIGANGAAFQFVNPAQVAAEQLTQFGFPTQVKAVDASIFYTNAQYPKNEYDMSVDWVENSWGMFNPYGANWGFYKGFAGNAGNFPRYKDGLQVNQLNMVLKGPDGQDVDVEKTLREMLYMSEEDMVKAGSKLSWIANENAFGVPFYQNVSGFWLNKKMLKGYPLKDLVEKYDRNVPVPENLDDLKIANDHWYLWVAQAKQFVEGEYAPN